jgi:tetratricopeptide (TPR) repeat protein
MSNMPTNKKMKGKPRKYPKEPTATDLLQAAEAALLTQNPDQAIELYKQASTRSSDPFQLAFILEQSAHAKLSLADQDGARDDYQQALEFLVDSVDPQNPTHLEQQAGLHLYIGQLFQGNDSLEKYKAGIDLLQSAVKLREERHSTINECIPPDDDGTPLALLEESKRQLSSAYCNAADLYLTDLCLEDNAEQECEAYISLALQLLDGDGQPSVDSLQTAASLRLSQNRGIEAADYALRVYERIRVGCEGICRVLGLNAYREDVVGGTGTSVRELTDIEEAQALPEFEFRVQTSKLLLECHSALKKLTGHTERSNECASAAVNVLGSLLAENDEVVEVCYLLGEAFCFIDQLVPALHFYGRAKEMLASVLSSIEDELADAGDDSDELQQQFDAVTCQFEECASKISELEEQLE